MLELLNTFDSFVWGPPLLILLMGTGILLTVRLNLLQVFKLPKALALIFTARNSGGGDVNSFQALCTALAATVGTGNIVGVATAVKAGGPGALFWMWIAAFFGMATKYAECLLAVKYRTVDDNGEISGGPMYYIEKGLGKNYRPLALAFAVFGVMTACFGCGTFAQINAISEITNLTFGVDQRATSIFLAILTALIVMGGLQSISNVSSKVVPFMAVLYILTTVSVLFIFADRIPDAIAMIIHDAFNPTAAAGGFLGATVMMAIRSGIARGIFSNEAGLGSAPIVAAAAKTKWAAEQGLISMTGTFIDTIIICSLTGLTLVVTGVSYGSKIFVVRRPWPVCVLYRFRLELLWRTLCRILGRRKRNSSLPPVLCSNGWSGRFYKIRNDLDDCGYRKWLDGISQLNCLSSSYSCSSTGKQGLFCPRRKSIRAQRKT